MIIIINSNNININNNNKDLITQSLSELHGLLCRPSRVVFSVACECEPWQEERWWTQACRQHN